MKRAFVFALMVAACDAPPVEKPENFVFQETHVSVGQTLKDKVDILFVVDNSSSMSPKQDQLRDRFPQLISKLADFGQTTPASYHIGVITSDVGAAASTLYCKSGAEFGYGRLVAKGLKADADCQPPTGGVRFIDYNQKTGTSNLPSGQTIERTFQCMAAVGDVGCGFEQSLEAAYQALANPPAENANFLREDALLVVVFVTDEDDCSAPPESNVFNTDASLGPINFRCTQWGVVCDDPTTGEPVLVPPMTAPPLTGCRSAKASDNGKLYDVQRYITLFSLPKAQGGLKTRPDDVLLVAIAADPAGGVAVTQGLTAKGAHDEHGQPVTCTGPITADCTMMLRKACVAEGNPDFFGDPAVRLKQVIDSAAKSQFTSICATDYRPALEKVADEIISALKPNCLTAPIVDAQKPACEVEDIVIDDAGKHVTIINQCPESGDPATFPCWRLEMNDQCSIIHNPKTDADEHYAVVIDRGPGGKPPMNSFADARCPTIAVLPDGGSTP